MGRIVAVVPPPALGAEQSRLGQQLTKYQSLLQFLQPPQCGHRRWLELDALARLHFL
jgi:hypothetical protein